MNPVSMDRLRGDDWQTLRDLRLAALQESPHAFRAKLSDERRYSREQWTSFLGAVAWFVARRVNAPIGMAGLLQQDPGPELIGMWVAPHERGQGVGAMLTRAVVDLATSQGATSVGLWVTDGNDTARAMYQRLGFEFTGEWAPLPHDAPTGEHQMRIVLGPGRA